MHAAQCSRDVVVGDVRLGYHRLQAVLGELSLAEAAREEARGSPRAARARSERRPSRAVSVKITSGSPLSSERVGQGSDQRSSSSSRPASSSVFRRESRTNRSLENIASSIPNAR